MSDYIKGSTRPHAPAEDQGISLAGMGIPPESMKAWNVLQGFFAQGETTPCAGRSEWSSNKAACAEFAEANGEKGAIWGGVSR